MNSANETFRTPARKKKFLLVIFTAVSVIIVGLVFLMARGPSDESIATDIVTEIMTNLPSDDISPSDLRSAGRRFEEVLQLAPDFQIALENLSELRRRIENQIHQAVLENQIEHAEDLLSEAVQIWSDEIEFQDAGIYRARIAEKRRERELQERLRARMSEMTARLETDPSRERSLTQAIELIEQLLNPDSTAEDVRVPRESLATLVERTTDFTLETDDVDYSRRMLTVLEDTTFQDESYVRLRDLLHEKLTKAEISQQINELLAEAEEHLLDDRLSMPEGRNALFSYRQVLALAPDNLEALNGIKRIEARYVALIEQSMVNNQVTAAGSHIRTLARVSPEQVELRRLRDKLQTLEVNAQIEQERRATTASVSEDRSGQDNEAVDAEADSEMLDDEESRLWSQVMDSCNQNDLRKYINTYPSGRYVQDAWQRISDCLAAE